MTRDLDVRTRWSYVLFGGRESHSRVEGQPLHAGWKMHAAQKVSSALWISPTFNLYLEQS